MKDPHDIRKAAIEDAIIARSEEASSKLSCFKCGDGSTPLYCLNCANDELNAKCAEMRSALVEIAEAYANNEPISATWAKEALSANCGKAYFKTCPKCGYENHPTQ